MAFFPKPAAGSWTENWPELGTAPVDYTDSIDPEQWKLEQQAIFKKCWLNVGRVERLPRKGSYFTREMPSAGPGTSVIIVKDTENEVRAFYNMCRHRGNKLVWNDFPGEEVSGTCRQFTCKYHAWRYSLKGDLTFVQQEGEFFDLDKANFGLVPVRCEVWEGFIFINFDNDAEPLVDYLGDFAKGLEGYPFHEMTETYSLPCRGQLQLEAVHRRVRRVLPRADPAHEAGGEGGGRKAGRFRLRGTALRHQGSALDDFVVGRYEPAEGPEHGQADRAGAAQRAVRTVGPAQYQGHPARRAAASGQPRPGRDSWGQDSFEFFPNFTLLLWAPGWYLTYHYWPTDVNKHIFECTLYFVPATSTRERLAHELAAVTFKEYAFQDANTLEATQTMINTGVVKEFPLCDQEILLRHLHKTAWDYVNAYKKENGLANGKATAGQKDAINA